MVEQMFSSHYLVSPDLSYIQEDFQQQAPVRDSINLSLKFGNSKGISGYCSYASSSSNINSGNNISMAGENSNNHICNNNSNYNNINSIALDANFGSWPNGTTGLWSPTGYTHFSKDLELDSISNLETDFSSPFMVFDADNLNSHFNSNERFISEVVDKFNTTDYGTENTFFNSHPLSSPRKRSVISCDDSVSTSSTLTTPEADSEEQITDYHLDIKTAIKLATNAISNSTNSDRRGPVKRFESVSDNLIKRFSKQSLTKTLPKNGSLICTHCNETFSCHLDMASHSDQFKLIRSHKCPISSCPFNIIGFEKKAFLRHHLISQHFKKGYLIPEFNQYGKEVHSMIYKCDENTCGKCFYRKDSLSRHIKLVHNNKSSKFNRKIEREKQFLRIKKTIEL